MKMFSPSGGQGQFCHVDGVPARTRRKPRGPSQAAGLRVLRRATYRAAVIWRPCVITRQQHLTRQRARAVEGRQRPGQLSSGCRAPNGTGPGGRCGPTAVIAATPDHPEPGDDAYPAARHADSQCQPPTVRNNPGAITRI